MDAVFDIEVEVDERTKEELQPPCESMKGLTPYDDHPAEWVTIEQCKRCNHVKFALRCNACKVLIPVWFTCHLCYPAGQGKGDICITLLHAEPLR